jgi:hypothetical protein
MAFAVASLVHQDEPAGSDLERCYVCRSESCYEKPPLAAAAQVVAAMGKSCEGRRLRRAEERAEG